ncbi:LIM and calponin homology domains-containing protein 1a isoform X2 [Colossoma macropomum]|uniref:LIM and calponin homology domains-containing protein 1a isoform X2 n=1 Tax=Colossoma macropomum TaxID=42526 RepID=UPI0018650F31|nr:LIM and calponin homology domains-containing protein 1a isoform X2 [Colossoma macropomum]
MASPSEETRSDTCAEQQHESGETSQEPAVQEAQKWIEAVTGRSFGEKDFRSGLENGILLCELLSSIKPGLVKKINRLPTPIAGLDNLTMFLRGCEELGLKGTQLFNPGDLQDTSIRANLTGSDCSRKLKNVLITIYWLGKTANSCAFYNGPMLDLKEFEGLLSMMRKECVSEESDSPKRNIRDSGYIDNWESERSDSLSPPRHGRDDSFDSLDSFGSRSQQTPSPDTVLRGNSDDSEGDGGPRRLPDVRKDDMSARRVSYKEPRAALPFNQYLPNKSNQTNYIPAPLRKRRSEREEEWRSASNATSPVGGERPLREECVGVLRDGGISPNAQKTVTWAVAKGAEPELGEEELKKMRKLEKAGIKVLPATVRYNSPKVTGVEPDQAKSPSPDIILRHDNDFLRADHPHDRDANKDDEDENAERRVPDVQKDDLASRRARMNQSRPHVTHHFLPVGCSMKDRKRWEGIRLASQHAVLERMEKMEQEKRSEADSASTEVSIITRKDNPFLTPRGKKMGEKEESDEEGEGRAVVPNLYKDDLARRRAQSGTTLQRDPRQSLVQTAITQSDLEKWQRLSMNTENSEASPAEASIITHKDKPFLTPEKARVREDEKEHGDEGESEGGGRAAVPNIQKDDLARRRGQTGALPQRDPRQTLVQTAITQSDLEKWQRLKMSTEDSDSPPAPLCQACLEKGSILAASSGKVAKGDLAAGRGRSHGDRRRFVTFGGVTEVESVSWKEGEEQEDEEEEEERRKERERDESETLRRLLSTATVAMPTIGVSSGLTAERAVGSGSANAAPALNSSSESPQPLTSVSKRSSALAEREALELRLAEKARDEKEYEENEEEEEKDRQPDIEKDDMMARRTGAFQKGMSGTSYNQFLPPPGSKRDTGGFGSKERSTDPLMLEKNIKTKRFKFGQRVDPVNLEPKLSASAATVALNKPAIISSTSAHSAVRSDCSGFHDDDEHDYESPLPDLEKDDMLTRRAGVHQKQSGSPFNVFLPKPGAVKNKAITGSAQYQSSEKEKTNTQDSNHGNPLSCTPSAVTPPSADVENTPKMLDRQEACTEGVMGGKSDILGGATGKTPSPKPDPNPRRPFWLEDDDLPPTSVSLIDMRDEEEVDTLSPHSQSRHERLHNQYNKLREEEDQWQDDLARWKNRRRSASQDLIKKEEERKMMEKLMMSEGDAHRRKSIKTYKEIVEEKERREQELHELYCKASTPEEKAAVLQRYALRFTISDAILEKLQLPKLPPATTAVVTSSPAHPGQQATYALNEEAEVSAALPSTQTQTLPTVQPHQQTPRCSSHSRPKTPELSPTRSSKTPEVPLSPTRVPPPPSKPVPLLTPKPYSQPKLNQAFYKPLKTDGLVRVNGECSVEETKETPAPVQPVSFSPLPPKLAAKSPQQEPEISPASETTAQDHTQTLSSVFSQETEKANEEIKSPSSPQEKSSEEETSTTLTNSELTEEKQTVSNSAVKRNCIIKTTIVTELTQTHSLTTTDMSSADQLSTSDGSAQKSCDEVSSTDSGRAEGASYSLSLTEPSHSSSSSRLRWEFFAPTEGLDFTSECIETPILNLAKRVDHWTWDPNEERKRQERWQQEQERLLQEKYQREQERLKKEWEKAQKEVEEEERKHNEEERRILEETVAPLTPRAPALSSPSVTEDPPLSTPPHDTVVLSLADWEKKQEKLEKETKKNGVEHSSDHTEAIAPAQQNGQRAEHQESQTATPQLQFIQDGTWSSKSESKPEWKKTASLDRNLSPSQTQPPRMRRTGSYENILGTHPSQSLPSSQDTPPPSPSRSVSGKKLCSSCAHPLGKGAAMIIETLGLYFHIQCFKCGVCKGLLGDTSAGTDVRIRNGVLNCQDCYIKSRAAGQPTTL